MRVLLIQPFITSGKDEFFQALSEPLGLLCLATYVEEISGKQIEVEILDLFALGHDKITERGENRIRRGLCDKEEIAAHLNRIKPDIIGIHSNFTGYAEDVIEIAGICKSVFPRIPITLGGAHASYDSKSILGKYQSVDYIVRKEGEETFYELVNSIKTGSDVGGIKGISFRNREGKVVSNPDRELINDLNTLPIPDRTLIDMGIYKEINKQSFPIAMSHPVATIMASRGCPYNCIFCSTKNMWGRKWRSRSPSRIVHEIEGLVTNYGIKEIVFYDDQFLVDRNWVSEVCDAIISGGFNISLALPAGTSVWLADKDLLLKMKRAGFYRLNFPIESANPDTIKFIRKPINLDKILEVIRIANRLGFWTTANFIIGFPHETEEDIKRTIRFAYHCGIDYAFFFIAKPFAGAELYDIFKKEGLLSESAASASVFVAKNDTLHLKAGELTRIRNEAERGFPKRKIIWLLNPFNLIQFITKILSIKGFKYSFRIFMSIVHGKHKR
ncbi:MAG: radical SAM protein [Elusimicrobia bacterium]|nr:radical SAM protein [Elusimicrobiota bacterium]